MSDVSVSSPTSPHAARDIRSLSQPFKRSKDARAKWSNGVAPSSGVKLGTNFEFLTGSEGQQAKVVPRKQWSQTITDYKSHANNTRKASNLMGGVASGRSNRKIDAVADAAEHSSSPLSRSLLELLPQHVNNTASAITTSEAGFLYSFDKNTSPGEQGTNVDLGGLVDKAEKRFVERQTERIVRGEYEVLDVDGEVVAKTKKGKKSPKQRAVEKQEVPSFIEEDDGFELI